MRQLELKEIQSRVLVIAKEFDRICSKYGIPYYMLGGTMLGAVRHHGFIPWDDDMDFGVPSEYYDQLVDLLTKELSHPFRCCTYKTHPAAIDNFLKIEDFTTVLNDPTINLPIDLKIGVNIDVFPLTLCNKKDSRLKKIQRLRILLGGFMKSKSHPNSKLRRCVKFVLRCLAGGKPLYVQQRIDRILRKQHIGDYLGNFLGRWGDKEIVPLQWYGDGARYVFEDHEFQGIKDFDSYLKQLYDDYMALPPEKDRTPHVDVAYVRDSF